MTAWPCTCACRYRLSSTPKADESALLARVDYAACKNENGAYRAVVLDGGRTLTDWPLLPQHRGNFAE